MVNRNGLIGTRLLETAYRAVVPAFIAMPLLWLVLNRFRAALYDGDHGPTFAFMVVITIQRYIVWAALMLFPFAMGVAAHWTFRRVRSRFTR